MKDFEFPLPPIEKQNRIAGILWAADEMKNNYSKVLISLQSLQDALISNLFRDASNRLTFKPALDVCKKISVGIVIKPASYYVNEDGVPALRSLNVFPGRFELDDLVYISKDGNKKNHKSILLAGDVAIVRTGRPGDVCVVGDEQAGFNAIDLIIARTNQEILPVYLCTFINSNFAKKQFKRGITGTAQTHFNIGEFKISKQGTQEGGYAFEKWFYELINYFEISARPPYKTGGRQIDGSLTLDGTTYLIETKFTNDQSGAPDIDIFMSKIVKKADNTMGIFVSMALCHYLM